MSLEKLPLKETIASVRDRIDAEHTSICEQCLTSFNIKDGFKLHMEKCPGVRIPAYLDYVRGSFVAGKVFKCNVCDLARRLDLEPWTQFDGEINCSECSCLMKTDICLHIHSMNETDIVCGCCCQKLDLADIQTHAMKHFCMRSFLFKICSNECLEKQLHHPQIGTFSRFRNKFSCFLCMKSFHRPDTFDEHLTSHGIESRNFQKITCPICNSLCWGGRRFRRHMAAKHNVHHDGNSKNQEFIVNGVCCDHCWDVFENTSVLSDHIVAEHFLLGDEGNNTDPLPAATSLSTHSMEIRTAEWRLHAHTHTHTRVLHEGQAKRLLPKAGFAVYLLESFCSGSLFKCMECHLPRAVEVEIIKPCEKEIVCINCRKGFYSDITCHIHKNGSQLVCGFCSCNLAEKEVQGHCENHILDRSYMVNICSQQCLTTVVESWSGPGISRRFKCMLCFVGKRCMADMKDHMYVHKPKSHWPICTVCNEQFAGNKKLSAHYTWNHRKKLSCPLCHRSISFVSQLLAHMVRMHKSATVPCLECDSIFESSSAYIAHSVTHQDGSYKCKTCAAIFPSMALLTNHERVHAVSSCTKCCEIFVSTDAAKLHKENCRRSYTCDHCKLSFKLLWRLRAHINSEHFTLQHELDNPRVCPYCSVSFYDKTIYNKHISKHKNVIEEYVCEICGVVKTSVAVLESHVFHVHKTAEFVCDECGKAFKLKHHLKQHFFYNHTDTFPFQCGKCKNSFRRESNLLEHQRRTCKALKGRQTGKS